MPSGHDSLGPTVNAEYTITQADCFQQVRLWRDNSGALFSELKSIVQVAEICDLMSRINGLRKYFCEGLVMY